MCVCVHDNVCCQTNHVTLLPLIVHVMVGVVYCQERIMSERGV